jgi:hypothetical protein
VVRVPKDDSVVSSEDLRVVGEEEGGVAERRSLTVSMSVSRNSFSETSASRAASTSAAVLADFFLDSLGFARNSLSQFIRAG